MSNLSELLPAGGGGKNVNFVASGTLSSGQTVVLNSDGTVSAVSETAEAIGTETEFQSGRSDYTQAVYDVNANKIVVFYFLASSNNVYGVVGTVSGSSISFGTPVSIVTGTPIYSTFGAVYDANAQKVIYGFRTGSASGLKVAVGTVSGTSISFGTPVAIDSGNNENGGSMAYDANAQKIVFSFPSASNSQYGASVVGTVSGTSISFGTKVIYSSAAVNLSTGTGIAYDAVAQKVLIGYRLDSDARGYGIVGTVSGTSISFGTTAKYSDSIVPAGMSLAYSSLSGKIIIVYEDSSTNNGMAIAATLSGTSVSYGTPITWVSNGVAMSAVNTAPLTEDTNAGVMVFGFANTSGNGQVVNFTVSGSTITASNITTWDSGTQNFYIGGAYHSVENKTVFSWQQTYTTGEAITYSPASTNAPDFIGITDAAISDTASGNITIKGGVASNTDISTPLVTTVNDDYYWITSGAPQAIAQVYDPDNSKFVVMGREGNIPRAYVGTVSGTSISYGSLVYPGGTINGAFFNQSLTYDTNANKFVFCYQDNSNSSYGTAVVGTLSGTSTTWGTPVVYASVNAAFNEVVYDSNAQKVAVFYKNQSASNQGVAIVGTVSGTSISFGSSTDFLASNTNDFALAYDTNAQKIFVAVTDFGASLGRAYVATISGTSISFGTPTTFLSGVVASNSLAAAYDSTNQKCILAYTDDGPDEGYMVVGTISGTSVSFGSATQYAVDLSDKPNINCMAYNATSQLINIIYNMPSGADQGIRTTFASVSGTTVTIEADVSLKTGGNTEQSGNLYDPDTGNIIVFYNDPSLNDANSNVVTTSTTLVPNSTYYVQSDGSLSTTSSSVTAGKALSATSINLDYSS